VNDEHADGGGDEAAGPDLADDTSSEAPDFYEATLPVSDDVRRLAETSGIREALAAVTSPELDRIRAEMQAAGIRSLFDGTANLADARRLAESASRGLTAAMRELGIRRVLSGMGAVTIPAPTVHGRGQVIITGSTVLAGVGTVGAAATVVEAAPRDLASLPREVEKVGIGGLSPVKVLAVVVLFLVMVGVPVETLFLPAPAQGVVSGEEAIVPLAVRLAASVWKNWPWR
jgi:hypothetical protein